MAFFDTFSEKFAAYKRENKRKKSFKDLKTDDKLKKFLQKEGSELKKDLKKAVSEGEKINFKNLPGVAINFFGKNFVAEEKRRIKWENAQLIRLTGESFKFNENNKVRTFLSGIIGQSSGAAFVVDYIQDDEESRKEAARQVIKNEGEKVKNEEEIFALFREISGAESSDTYWEAWGLFADDDEYRIFINIVNK